MLLNEVPDYRVPRRESVRYDYSNSLAVAIGFCSLWLLCRLKKRWLTNAKSSLCNSIAEMWKRCKKVENLAQPVHSTKPIVTAIKAEVDRPKNTDSSNDQLNTTSFFDMNNFTQMTERSLMIEKVYLRKHLLTCETKLYASMRQTMEVRKMLLRVKGIEMPIRESLAQRRRSSLFDRSTKLVSFIAKIVKQKDEVIEKLLKHTEEILELNENLGRENERITLEAGFKRTRSSPASL